MTKKLSMPLCCAALAFLLFSCASPPPRGTDADKGKAPPEPQASLPPATTAPAAPAQNVASLPAGLSAADQAFLANYLSRLSYMVYYNDASGLDPRFAKMAVIQANRYLIEKQGLAVIDVDQIERNKKDQMDAYQAETGGSIDMIQYLAQKFNADIYVEIDLKASGTSAPDGHRATAQGTMKLFETSTAQLLGSITFNSPPTFSPVSQDGAISNAITASIWQAMPRMTEQARSLLGAAFSKGIRYELAVQGLPDAKQVSVLVKALSRKFGEVEQLSFASGDTRIALFGFMTKAKVQEAIYDAAATALLPDMYMVYMRGKSFTFNSGL